MTTGSKIRSFLHDTWLAWKKRLTAFVLNAPAVILTAAVIVTLVGIGCMVSVIRSRPERNAASVWSQGSDVSYRHVAVYSQGSRSSGDTSPAAFTGYGKSLAKTDVYNIRKSLQAIVDSSNGVRRRTSDKPSDPEGWTDAYCSYVNADLNCDHNDFEVNCTVPVYAVGGNFRAFHPMEFMSGGFLPVQSVDKYQIVLNDELAWRLFSSYDVIGGRVTLWGKDFTIIGVVREHDDKDMRAYVYYDCLEEYASGLDVPVTPAVLCYEAMLPEPVDGVAVMDVKNSIPGYDAASPSCYVVSVTGRYTIPKIWSHMMPPGEMSAFLQGYELPFWEMSAQKAVSDIFAWMIVLAFCLLLSVCMIIMLVRPKLKN
ncbi:hypothetical protein SAMN02910456_00511 [Ruminococcaceae bacterium YRB3002]|nr:hypothetical protein SAMN02910456_00511 [Ruminococcaceae bacterium YRB3002]